jgi:hypothetical protein
MINEYGAIVECELAGETEDLGENLPHHMTWPGTEPRKP